MLRITDRYILREVVPPFLLALLVLTFVLMLPPLMNEAEELITKGVDGVTIASMMLTLVPQALGLALPMALLMGILMGLGRMSTDRETVALQACGVSVYRMLGPVGAPRAPGHRDHLLRHGDHDPGREPAFPGADAASADGPCRRGGQAARVLRRLRRADPLRPGDLPAGWSDVFLADSRDPGQLDVSVAEYGRVEVDRNRQRVDLVLHNGTRHRSDANDPAAYELHEFSDIRISIGTESVFPQSTPQRGLNELRLPELRQEVDRMRAAGESPAPADHGDARAVLAADRLPRLRAGRRRPRDHDPQGRQVVEFRTRHRCDLRLLRQHAPAGGHGQGRPGLAAPGKRLPNIVLGLAGLVLVAWRSHLSERRISVRRFGGRGGPHAARTAADAVGDALPSPARTVRPTARGVRGLSLLDWYVVRMYLRWVSMAVVGLLGVFYISTFIDLADKLFKGETNLAQLLEYFWYATPQFAYYVLPISALMATLVTIGALTRSSELTVMKACGISLARAALPMFVLSLVWSGCLFALEESVLGQANRRAEAIRHEIRSGSPPPTNLLNRRWIAGAGNTLYHSRYVDPERVVIDGLSVYELEDGPWRIRRRTYAARATFDVGWEGRGVWTRQFPATGAVGTPPTYTSAAVQPLPFLDPPETFRTEQPDPDVMGFRELGGYIETLRARGLDVVGLVVALHRKASFPFVCLVLTLIAVPFAVTTGSRGALYGVGAGIVLAFAYYVILSVFGAIGSAGLLTPALAAWSPNVLFGGTAAYLLLTART